MNCRLTRSCHIALILALAAAAAPASGAPNPSGRIEDLTPPKPAPPPSHDADESPSSDLERKRRERRRREDALTPAPVPYAKKRAEGLRRDTLQPRPRWLLMELALVAGSVETDGAREGYLMDPTTHFNVFFRSGAPAVDGKVGVWYGARVAPFSGTGYYKKTPGSYGLTYFGPMIGVGKVAPVPADGGSASTSLATDGWVVTTGIAAVTRQGRTEGVVEDKSTNDFVSKRATIDASGLWLEARYLRVLYGGLGFDVLIGAQTGRDKTFLYAGIGAAGWY